MRAGMVVFALLAACDGQHGAYLIVEGGELAFTEVEFYFGARDDKSEDPRPVPRLRKGDDYRGLQQIGLARQVIDGLPDVVRDADGDGRLTYYLPSTDENAGLAYVLALARDANGTPVGVAEAGNIHAPNDAAYEYRLTLEPFATSGALLWGNGGEDECVMWRRDREGIGPSIVAVVREDDRDCDASPSVADCDDIAYCPPGSQNAEDACEASMVPCVDDQCRLGVCVSRGTITSGAQEAKTCVVSACLAEAWCDACVQDRWNVAMPETLQCIAAYEKGIPLGHYEVLLPANRDGALCELTASVQSDIPCEDVQIEYPPLPDPNGFTYTFTSTSAGVCTIRVVPSTALPPAPFVGGHLVVSFPHPNMPPPLARTYAVIGIGPKPGGDCAEPAHVEPAQPAPGYPRCAP